MSCKDCIFCETVVSSGGPFGGPQIGCSANRFNKYIASEKAELAPEGFYSISQFCNLFRDTEWKKDWEQSETDLSMTEKARSEITAMFGFIILGEKDIAKTTNSIVGTNYDKSKLRIIFSIESGGESDLGRRLVMDQVNILKKIDIVSQMIIHTSAADRITIDSRCVGPLMGEKCNYIIKTKSGEEIDPDYLNFIDTTINDNLEKYTFFEDGNGIQAIHANVINHSYIEVKDYDLMCEQLREMAIKQGSYKKYEKKKEIYN